MRMRSTGLGTTELVGEINTVTQAGDFLVLHVGTIEPVRWHVRAAMSSREMLKIFWLMLKPSTIFFMFIHLFHKPRTSPPPEY
jgi:hypothetical protein